MNICVEGPDNSGKTTLVEALAQIYERQVRHATKPANDIAAKTLFEEEVADDGKWILDRSQAISGYIYDAVVRKQIPLFDMDHIAELAHSTLLIICLPPKELVLEDNGREQMEGVNENLSALYDAYAELCKDGYIGDNGVFVFDYTKHHLGDVIDWITDMLGGLLY